MKHTDKWNTTIVAHLTSLGIHAVVSEYTNGMIAVNRTSCHQASMCAKMWEGEILDAVLATVREHVNDDSAYISWSGKTDDDWFLDIYERS